MKFWNGDRTQTAAIDIGDLEKHISQESVTGAGNLGQIEGENAPEKKTEFYWQKMGGHLN